MRSHSVSLLALLGIGLHSAWVAEALVCPATGKDAPAVTTLSVSKDGAKGVVVNSDCTSREYGVDKASNGIMNLQISDSGIQQVESYPASVEYLVLDEHNGLTGGDFRGGKLSSIDIIYSQLTSLDGFLFPKTLTYLGLSRNLFVKIAVPDGVTTISLFRNNFETLKGSTFPSSVTNLILSYNAFTDAKFQVPNSVQYLDLGANPIKSLEGIGWSSAMQSFTCTTCSITTIRGVKFTRSFKMTLDSTVTNFEIRESDAAIVKTMNLAIKVSQPTCWDATAKRVVVSSSITACTITDDRFEKKYVTGTISRNDPAPVPGATTDAPSPGSTTTPGSKVTSSGKSTRGSAADGESTKDGSSGSSTGTGSGGSSDNTASGESSGSTELSGGSGSTANSQGWYQNGTAPDGSPTYAKGNKASGGDKGGGSGGSTTSSSKAASSSALITVLSIGAAILVGLVLIVFRYRRRKMQSEKTEVMSSSYDAMGTDPSNSSQEYSSNDILNDEVLIPFRIDRGDILLSKVIARGGFGVIYAARYNDRAVAVKQLLPEHSRNNNVIKQFMDEVRLCAKLEHPKIVEFVGITFSSLRDLAIVIEFMARGDLHSILYDSAHRPQTSQWFAPSKQLLKPKTVLAIDVSQALTYLHSFDQPIIHRDLKARNVLIGNEGNAKLSDFGISREVSIDETMTGEVSTLAWIAPEILRGERYSEKADSYSFGVLLSEMDRGGHPYGIGDRVESATHGGQTNARNNTQIALLVSSGELKPEPSAHCPIEIGNILTRCVAFRAEDRPTSMELFYQLRQLQQAHS